MVRGGNCSLQLWARGGRGCHSLLYLQGAAWRALRDHPRPEHPSSKAPSKLPWYLVISGCTLSCRTDSSARCRGPRRRRCSPPRAPSSSSPPCTACSSAGPNSSSCPPRLPSPDSPCSPWPALLGGGGGSGGPRLILREVTFAARVKAGCFGLGFGAGLPQALQGPRLSPATCARAAPPPGSWRPGQRLPSPALCASTPGGAGFRASPKPQPFPASFPASGYAAAPHPAAGPWLPAPQSGVASSRLRPGPPLPCASREMPEYGGTRPRFHRSPSLSAPPGQRARQMGRGG